jgi:hypothetical protein
LTCTTATLPTAFTILLARVLNAPHCLQASIVTIFSALLFFGSATAALLFILEGAAFFAAGAGFFLAGDDSPFAEERVVRAIVGTTLVIHEGYPRCQQRKGLSYAIMPSLRRISRDHPSNAMRQQKVI